MQTACACPHAVLLVPPNQVCSAARTNSPHNSGRQWHRHVSRSLHALQLGYTKQRHLHVHEVSVRKPRKWIAYSSADREQAPAGNGIGSVLAVAEHNSSKDNGSIHPSLGGDDGAGRGNGSGGSGNGYGRGGDGSFNEEPDGQSKLMLTFLSIVVGAATVYGGYHLWTAVEQQLFKQQQTTPATLQTNTPTESLQQATDSQQQR